MARRPREPLTADTARGHALRALGRREHSARELKGKLAAQGLAESDAESLLENLQTGGWQSDARYAELLIRSRISQGYGLRRIAAELSARGVEDAVARTALAAIDFAGPELALAAHAKRFGRPPLNAAEARKQYRFLAGRGFESAHIRAALKEAMPDEEGD